MSGHLDELPPPELAAVLEAISTEVNRPDLWCGFPPPPAVDEALHDLRGLRRELGRQQERAKVAFPIVVPARSSRLLFVRDPKWMQ
jgi:superfamily II RNA helicase